MVSEEVTTAISRTDLMNAIMVALRSHFGPLTSEDIQATRDLYTTALTVDTMVNTGMGVHEAPLTPAKQDICQPLLHDTTRNKAADSQFANVSSVHTKNSPSIPRG